VPRTERESMRLKLLSERRIFDRRDLELAKIRLEG